MNQYPTLLLSFKNVDGLDFPSAYAQLVSVLAKPYKSHLYLTESDMKICSNHRMFENCKRKYFHRNQ